MGPEWHLKFAIHAQQGYRDMRLKQNGKNVQGVLSFVGDVLRYSWGGSSAETPFFSGDATLQLLPLYVG